MHIIHLHKQYTHILYEMSFPRHGRSANLQCKLYEKPSIGGTGSLPTRFTLNIAQTKPSSGGQDA